jgi:hypothetical protein
VIAIERRDIERISLPPKSRDRFPGCCGSTLKHGGRWMNRNSRQGNAQTNLSPHQECEKRCRFREACLRGVTILRLD